MTTFEATCGLRDLYKKAGDISRSVSDGNGEVIITEGKRPLVVIISMADYEKLQQYADVAAIIKVKELQEKPYEAVPLAGVLDDLGVDSTELNESNALLGSYLDATTCGLRDLYQKAGDIARTVAASGHEVIITEGNRPLAAIIAMGDYEKLQQHADIADAVKVKALQRKPFEAVSMPDMLDLLGMDPEELVEFQNMLAS